MNKSNNSTKLFVKFILIIPILNSIATVSTEYFSSVINPGTIRGLILFVMILYFYLKYYTHNSLNRTITLFIFYLLIIVISFSSNTESYYLYLKVFSSFLLFPIGYYVINSPIRFKKLLRSFYLSMIILVASVVVSNVFSLGTSDYLGGTFYFGVSRVNITKSIAIYILMSPLLYYVIPPKKMYQGIFILVLSISIGLVLIGLKRSAIMALIIGAIIYLILGPLKIRFLKTGIILFSLLSILSYQYIDTFFERIEARKSRFQFTNEEFQESEGRILEVWRVTNDFKDRNIIEILFGVDLFNDREYYHEVRMLHTDYMILLHGAGIVGLLWFLFIHFKILFRIRKFKQIMIHNKFVKNIYAVSLSIIVSMFILSIAGTIYSIEIRGIFFLFMGACTKVMLIYMRSNYFRYKLMIGDKIS